MKLEEHPPFPWQQSMWGTLCSQFESQQLAHAFMISGSLGTGKKLFVREFAKFVMCMSPDKGLACGECRSCLFGEESGHPDISLIEVEDGSRDIKIEQIRGLSNFLSQTSHAGRAKIAIIADAHRMNFAAANALLKTLEEPTAHTYLFLVSHLPGSLPATIRSRCQKLFMPIPTAEVAIDWIKRHLADQEDPKAHALAARNCPLLALELAQSGGLENQIQFLQKLKQLSVGKTSIQATATLAVKLGEQAVIGYLLEVSTILIKYLLTNQQPSESESEYQDLLAWFRRDGVASAQMPRRLMQFYGLAVEAQRQLMSGSNPNPQLIMESLLWRWSQLSVLRQAA
ncbi:MAG: DNA polymerase III subunit delta' [Pseudomonadales bacterium]|nr:DNA polymerase III subunit delta' [Pseudomonadales bacterium]